MNFQDFFGEIGRILKPGGIVTVVTDNLWYGRFLLNDFANEESIADSVNYDGKTHIKFDESSDEDEVEQDQEIKLNEKASAKTNFLVSKTLEEGSKFSKDKFNPSIWEIEEEANGFMLFKGSPGVGAGHIISASSYFDRY